jgi:hypothetical protein
VAQNSMVPLPDHAPRHAKTHAGLKGDSSPSTL